MCLKGFEEYQFLSYKRVLFRKFKNCINQKKFDIFCIVVKRYEEYLCFVVKGLENIVGNKI